MKDEKKKPPDIRELAFRYALRSIKLYKSIQEGRDSAGWILSRQYLWSATSIGANIEEAQSGESRADFLHKYGIAQKEAKESLYWLRLIAASGSITQKRLDPLMRETDELIAVITAIIVNTKRAGRDRQAGSKAELP